MEANKIQVIDDQGNEKEFEVLFTFNNDELNKQYVLYYDASLDEPSVYASIYDEMVQKLQEQGAYLTPKKDYQKISDFVFKPTGEGWELVEEVFQSFMGEQQNNHECCHDGNGCHHHDEKDHECCHGQGHGDHECCHNHENEEECCHNSKNN